MIERDELASEIKIELLAVQHYLDTIQLNQSYLSKRERERYITEAKLFSLNQKEEDTKVANSRGDFLEHYVLPRYLGNSFIVILWALFEDEMTQMAKFVEEKYDGPSISLSELKRGDFLDQIERFFEVCAVFWEINSDDVRALKSLYAIRNQIVHQNSRKTISTDRKVLKLIKPEEGNSIISDRIVIGEAYCRSSFDLVAKVLLKQLDCIPKWWPYD